MKIKRFSSLILSMLLILSLTAGSVGAAEPVDTDASFAYTDISEEDSEDAEEYADDFQTGSEDYETADEEAEGEEADRLMSVDEEDAESYDGEDCALGYVPAPFENEYESRNTGDGDGFFDVTERKYISPEVLTLPSRHQGIYGTCWAHATMAGVETSAIKHGVIQPDGKAADEKTDMSELHLAYFTQKGLEAYDPLGGLDGDRNGVPAGEDFLDNGGSPENAANMFACWTGAASEEKYPYSEASKTYTSDRANSIDDAMHLRGYYIADPKTDRNGVKELVKNYGAVTVSFCAIRNNGEKIGGLKYNNVYSEEYNSYFIPKDDIASNHSVAIVGWDDDFPRRNFANSAKPAGDGAWLIRNSWMDGNFIDEDGNPIGTDAGFRSYFWLSYFDKSIEDSGIAFEMDTEDNYDHNYQYDGAMINAPYSGSSKYANIFTAASDDPESLRAVYFATYSADFDCTIDVYTGVTGTDPQSGTHALSGKVKHVTFPGGYTVELDSPVMLTKGEKFSVVLTVPADAKICREYTNTTYYVTTAHTEPGRGMSFIPQTASWDDASDDGAYGDYRIKAFTADESAIQPTVTFDPNGGTCETESKTVTYLKKYGELPEATRDGYTFDGWFTEVSGGSEVTYSTKVTSTTDHTVHAHWTPCKYTVSFDANGGTCETESKEVTYGGTYGTLPDATRSKYDLQGWFTLAEGGDEIKSDTTVDITTDQTLYAHWLGNEIRVDFDADGGTCDPEYKMVNYMGTYGVLPVPEKPGCEFLGWYPEGAAVKKVEESTKVETDADHTLYAKWKIIEYGITFDANGGTCKTESITATYGNAYGTLPTPERENFVFDGWFTLADGGEKIEEDTVFYGTDDQTLFAHWHGVSVRVSLYADGGTVTPTSLTVYYDAPYGTLPEPVREGCEFGGWYTSMIGGTKVTATTKVLKTTAHTLYARWNSHQYKVYLNPNAEDATCPREYVVVDSGSTYGELPAAVREGFAFAGWYTAPEDGTWITPSTRVNLTADQTLFAHWTTKPFTVYFDANGGTVSPEQKDVITGLPYGPLPEPVYTGYAFLGWFLDLTDDEPVTKDTEVTAVDEHTLHAKWRGAPYTVTFDPRGGTVEFSSKTVYFKDVYGTLPEAEMDGYDFLGWYTSIAGGEHIHEDTAVTITAAQTLFAHWSKKSVTVTLDGNGGKWNGKATKKIVKEWGTVLSADDLAAPSYDRKHAFTSWYRESGCIHLFDTTEPVKDDVTIFAGWDESGALDFEGFMIEGLDGAFEYTGSAIKPNITVYYGDYERELTEGVDYSVAYKNNINAADRNAVSKSGALAAPMVTVTGKGNYSGTLSETFTISPIPMSMAYTDSDRLIQSGVSDANIILAGTGKSQKVSPVFTVTLSDGRNVNLKKGTDYTLEREEFTDAGNYVVKVYGKGNYSGQREFVVRIRDVAHISRAVFPAIPDQPYDAGFSYILAGLADDGQKRATNRDGSVFEWHITDPATKNELVFGKDYELAYDNNSDAGTAGVTVLGKGSYTGTVRKTFAITGIIMKNVKISGDPAAVEYTGYPVKIAGSETGTDTGGVNLTAYVPGIGNVLLEKGTDYTVSYSDNINPGNACVTYTGKGRVSGSIKKTFKIRLFDMSKAGDKITVRWPDGSQVWAGSNVPVYECTKTALKPEPVVIYTYNGAEICLAAGKDYTLSWSNTVKPAAYNVAKNAPTVNIVGKGNFMGMITRTFTITNGRFASFVAGDVAYQKEKTGLHLKTKTAVKDSAGTELKAGTDYYSLNDKTVPADFRFVSFDFDDSEVNGRVLVKSGRNWAEKNVSAGEAADSSYCILPGTKLRVTVYGKGSYEGESAAAEFSIGEIDFSKASASIGDITYTGKPITADDLKPAVKVEIKVNNVKQNLVCDSDFVIDPRSFINNVNAGTAKVTLRGKPESGYAGEKTVSFKIVPDKLNCTVSYEGNNGDASYGLIKAVMAADPDGKKTYAYYSTHYRVSGTMKDSSTPIGGKLTRNAFKVQKYDDRTNKWGPLPASSKIKFKGWTADAEGTGRLYADAGDFLPSWAERLLNRYNTWTLHAQWEAGK